MKNLSDSHGSFFAGSLLIAYKRFGIEITFGASFSLCHALFTGSGERPSAVDDHVRARDAPAGVGEQEQDGVGDVLGGERPQSGFLEDLFPVRSRAHV